MDEFSKLGGILLLGIYVCGYLVLSLYFSKFGFAQSNPLRPRVLEAGAAAFAFTAIPVLIGAAVSKFPRRNLPPLRLLLLELFVAPILCDNIAATPVLDNSITNLLSGPFKVASEHVAPKWHIFWLLVAASQLLILWLVWKRYHVNWRLSLLGLMAVSSSFLWITMHQRQSHALLLWFIGIAEISLTVYSLLNISSESALARATTEFFQTPDPLASVSEAARIYRPVAVFTLFIPAVWIFSTFVYGTIPVTLGGGAPTLVGLTLKQTDEKPSLIINSGTYYMLDETDQGVFVYKAKDERNIEFIPKERIQEILFTKP